MNLHDTLLDNFNSKFLTEAKFINLINSKEKEDQACKERIEKFKQRNFREVEGLKYDIYKEYELRMMLTLLSMNNNLFPSGFKPENFEKDFPPQYTFEILVQ